MNRIAPIGFVGQVATCVVLAVVTAGCHAARPPAPVAPAAEQLALGSHSYPITTASPAAQRAFDRGLTLAYAFSHDAAEQEFRYAAALDPDCAMVWWGVALVQGPHINFATVPPERATKAWEALQNARARAPQATARERALIDALATRYADPQTADRQGLDRAYADAMRQVWQRYPDDADVGTLFAESMMDLRPWDLWTQDGKPQPGTEEIDATLTRVLQLAPQHPGANHLYIHLVEASPHPEQGVVAADRLRTLVPDAGHLVHMPGHIDVRVGRWGDAAEANRRAIAADARFRAAYPRPGFYATYMMHNQHFLAYAAMMQGQSAVALAAARQMLAEVPEEAIRDYTAIVDGFMIFASEVLMRFGRWEEILAEPEPRPELPLSQALWHFTRGVALTALGRLSDAERERAAFHVAAEKVPVDWTFGNNRASDILAIAEHLLSGEMAAKRGRLRAAIALLREAVMIEDRLRYDEPPDWMQPARHTLGAVLLRAKRFREAESVYREDLARYPENGWALFGLARALRLQHKDTAATAVEARFAAVWAHADVTLGSTCYCQPGG
jgi:tetratricopeptide (TPR) repeat protein